MKSKIKLLKQSYQLAAIAYMLIFILAVSCDNSSSSDQKPTGKIKLATSSTLGSYLTDSEGNTLYFFTLDAAGANTCTGGCATAWPIFYEADLTQDLLATGLSLADFATITTTGGAKQTTYKGWPLYYYAPGGVRELPNETKGEAVGTVWFVAKPDYTIMLANAQLVGLDGKNYKDDYTEGAVVTQYFTDAKGRTLYTFEYDNKNKNNYTTGDASHDASWPIYTETLASVPSTLDKSLFGTIDVSGQKQLTYKGWPIYYFGADAQRGENKGVSVPSPGVWPVVEAGITEAQEPEKKVKLVTSATLGKYLTDSDSNTLYFFTRDSKGANTCTGGCATAWPIFYTENLTQDLLASGLSADDFATITTAGGDKQTTYKGWPLYYYAPGGTRELPNETKGEAVGTVWYVAKPDYTIMLANAQLVGLDGKNYKDDYTEGTAVTQYFTDAKGRTLYTFAYDKKNKNNYTNGDATHDANWPVFADDFVNVPSTLDKTLFGTIDVSGKKQITYNGWPVYYFGSDSQRGDNKGVSVPSPGVWPVVEKGTSVASQ